MKVITIEFSKTVQVADYSPETTKMVANLEEGDCPVTSLGILKSLVSGIKEEAPQLELKLVKEAPKKEEVKVEEVKEEVVEEVKEAPVKKAKKVVKKKVVKKAKTVAYDRDLKQHKELMGSLLTEVAPEWKIKGSTAKAKALESSKSLAGEAFLDAKGEILESFRTALTEKMK